MSEDTGAAEIAGTYFLSEEYQVSRKTGEIFDGDDMVNSFVAGAQWAQGIERK